MNNNVLYKTFIYWPDGTFKEAPNDGYIYTGNADTYLWDGHLETWVSGCGGKMIDFAPTGMPAKVYEFDDMEGPVVTESVSHAPTCECGAVKTSNPDFHSTWCPRWRSYE